MKGDETELSPVAEGDQGGSLFNPVAPKDEKEKKIPSP